MFRRTRGQGEEDYFTFSLHAQNPQGILIILKRPEPLVGINLREEIASRPIYQSPQSYGCISIK